MIEPEHLQRMLDDAWDSSPEGEGTLRATLRTFETEDAKAIDGGALVSVSAGGRASAFVTDPRLGLTLDEKVKGWRALINQFDRLYAYLGTPANTDQAVYDAMRLELANPIEEVQNVYTFLRNA